MRYRAAEKVEAMDVTRKSGEHGRRALLVDDNEAVRGALHEVVTRLGYDTDAAAGGREALALFETNHYDVVLTDLLMPGMTGFDLLEAVRLRNPKIPVVIVTGAAVYADDRRVARPGVVLVRKPVDIAFLESALTQVLQDLE
jgi:CheY-like chemotaxis protein